MAPPRPEQPIDAEDIEDLDDDRVAYEGSLVTGEVLVRDDEGRLYELITFVAGIQEGLTREFWPNGQVRSEHWYEGGVIHGVGRTWHENGRLASETRYRHGLVLDERTWSKDGTELTGRGGEAGG
jgi:antitoxin component YwqK of YwqJK toxin-antitoxin module